MRSKWDIIQNFISFLLMFEMEKLFIYRKICPKTKQQNRQSYETKRVKVILNMKIEITNSISNFIDIIHNRTLTTTLII
jgi:hypothetical protein